MPVLNLRHACLSLFFMAAAPLATATEHAQAPVSTWTRVDDAALDSMRGGFSGAHDLKVSFGIERVVFINGTLVSTTQLMLPDVSLNSGAQEGMPAIAPGTLSLIQNGPGNTAQFMPLKSDAAATFIQNTLNDQAIRSLTVVNTATNSMDLFKGLNTQFMLRDALVNAIGPR